MDYLKTEPVISEGRACPLHEVEALKDLMAHWYTSSNEKSDEENTNVLSGEVCNCKQ